MKWILSVLLFSTLTYTAIAQEFNAGFVQGLWYESDDLFANNQTRIYVAIRNNTGSDLTGTVEFFDNDMRIERNNVSALDGRIIESWTDWTPSYGEHTITATISRIELHKVGSSTRAIEVVSASTTDSFFVDYDIDKDGIGNIEDTDDDGDGIEDDQEISDGTDPLDASDSKSEELEDDDNHLSEKEEDEQNTGGSEASARADEDSQNGPEGLEKYISEGQGNSILSSITNTINSTKRKIDDYREERNSRDNFDQTITETRDVSTTTNDISSTISSSLSSSTPLSSQSYKMIVFDTSSSGSEVSQTKEKTENEGGGVFSSVFDVAKNISSGLYTLLLFLFSLYLSNPAIVQITLLVLILLLIYKVMRRLGGRRNQG